MVYDIPEPFDCCGLTHTEKIGAAIIADGVDAVIVASRNNLRLGASQIKLMGSQSRVAAKAAGRAVDVSADDFDDED